MRQLAATTGELQFVFDLMPATETPETGLVGRMLEAAMKRSTGGRGFERSERTRDDIVAALHEAGFDDAAAVAASDIARAWGLPDAARRTQVVLFIASCTRPLDS